MMFKYTLCFIRRADTVLMLNRRKAPNMGLWNGVGGKLEPGEEPLAGVLREVAEETGLHLAEARFSGTLTWTEDGGPRQGIYIFLAEAPPHPTLTTPKGTPEGILDWLNVSWITHLSNRGVVSNIRHFLPHMLGGEAPVNHHFIYRGDQLVGYEREPLQQN